MYAQSKYWAEVKQRTEWLSKRHTPCRSASSLEETLRFRGMLTVALEADWVSAYTLTQIFSFLLINGIKCCKIGFDLQT